MHNAMLEVFVEVADRGSFTKAAETLYISSTAIMKQMNILEEHLGLQLLIRTPRGIHLTEAGKSIYKDADYIVIRYDKLKSIFIICFYTKYCICLIFT